MSIDQQIDAEYEALKKRHGEGQLNRWFRWSQTVPEVKQKVNSLVGKVSTTKLYGLIQQEYNRYHQTPQSSGYLKAAAAVAAIAMMGFYLL